VGTPLVLGMDARLDVPITGGGRMLVDTADVTGRVLATSGVWEPGVTALFRQLIRPGDVVVDVGANIGYFTILAARLVGLEGHVHALEPAPDTHAALVANIRRNGLGNVTAHAVAAAASTGTATLHHARGVNAGASSLRSDPGPRLGAVSAYSVDVPLRPLAELVPPEQRSRLRLVKIDVEGYEADVLEGLAPLFEEGHRPSLVIEMHPDLDPGVTDAVPDFCDRFELRIERLVDSRGGDRERASHRPVVEPLDRSGVGALGDARYDVVLTPTGRGAVRSP
jgi:FkbM family methyltransferase